MLTKLPSSVATAAQRKAREFDYDRDILGELDWEALNYSAAKTVELGQFGILGIRPFEITARRERGDICSD
ncbi:MAG TPA: hypothetical protein VFW73_03310 [Lacipirellulaceae bacterium]|nr:hypothetical protein [Lacipirellulaceae bacterium]